MTTVKQRLEALEAAALDTEVRLRLLEAAAEEGEDDVEALHFEEDWCEECLQPHLVGSCSKCRSE